MFSLSPSAALIQEDWSVLVESVNDSKRLLKTPLKKSDLLNFSLVYDDVTGEILLNSIGTTIDDLWLSLFGKPLKDELDELHTKKRYDFYSQAYFYIGGSTKSLEKGLAESYFYFNDASTNEFVDIWFFEKNIVKKSLSEISAPSLTIFSTILLCLLSIKQRRAKVS